MAKVNEHVSYLMVLNETALRAALPFYLLAAGVNCAGKSILESRAFQFKGKRLTAVATSIKPRRCGGFAIQVEGPEFTG